jgi:hypothetical protein
LLLLNELWISSPKIGSEDEDAEAHIYIELPRN